MRKSNNLSQEELANKIGVTRQTISKWELGETTPDLKQLNNLSNVFNVSINELTNSESESKVHNDELEQKILKYIGITLLCIIILCVTYSIAYKMGFKNVNKETDLLISCNLENKDHYFSLSYNKNDYTVITFSGDGYIINELNKDFTNTSVVETINYINDFFTIRNGKCN